MIVYVHGLCGAASLWDDVRALVPARSGDRDGALDLPGHGARAHEAPLTSVDALAADVLSQIARLASENGAERITLVGHSLGGAVAQAVAARAPDRIERLVLVSTALRFATARQARALLSVDEPGFFSLFGPSVFGTSPATARSQALYAAAPRAVLDADLAAAALFDGRALAAPRGVRAVVVGGALDAVAPPEAGAKLAAAWAAAHVVVEGRAHMLLEEDPGAVAHAIGVID